VCFHGGGPSEYNEPLRTAFLICKPTETHSISSPVMNYSTGVKIVDFCLRELSIALQNILVEVDQEHGPWKSLSRGFKEMRRDSGRLGDVLIRHL
jgi:hypothetical protein